MRQRIDLESGDAGRGTRWEWQHSRCGGENRR